MKRFLVILVPLFILFVIGSMPSEPVTAAFAPDRFLPRGPEPGEGTSLEQKWKWPDLDAFRHRFERYETDGWALRVVEGEFVAGGPGHQREAKDYFVVGGTAEELWITPFLSSGPFHRYNPWQVAERALLGPGTYGLANGEGLRASLRVRRASPRVRVQPEAWEHWVYTTGLLESDSALRETVDHQRYGSPEEADAFWEGIAALRESSGQAAVSEILKGAMAQRRIDRYDHRWRDEAISAVEAGEHYFALSIYRYFVPIGNCSMDTFPRVVTAEYADLCYRLGMLGGYLRLRVQLMADAVPRIVYTSYAEASNDTDAQELLSTGLDIDRFLMGLAIQVDTREPNGGRIGVLRLARAIVESDRVPTLRPAFEAMAQDPDGDEWNLTLAALVLAGIWLYDVDESNGIDRKGGAPLRDIAELESVMESYSLTRGARAWLRSLRSEH